MRLGIKDHKVIRAFVERTSLEGNKLSTDGKRLDGHWLGGSRIADWQSGEIVFHDLGSRAAQSVQKQVRYHAAPNMLQETHAKHTKSKRTASLRRSKAKRSKSKRGFRRRRAMKSRNRRVRVGVGRRGFGVMRAGAKRSLTWKREPGMPGIQAPISHGGSEHDYVISHRTGQHTVSFRPPGKHEHVGQYKTEAAAKASAARHHATGEKQPHWSDVPYKGGR